MPNNASLKITSAGAKRLLEYLDSVPMNKRDAVWHQLHGDVKKISDIWFHVNMKKSHLSKIQKQANAILSNTTIK